MSIDWFTVLAQAVNFLLLAWLLSRFLYRPILSAIDEREKRTALVLKEAEEKRAAAERDRLACELQARAFDERRQGLWQTASEEVGASQEALLAQARREVGELRAKWLQALDAEKQDLREELRRRVEEEIWAVVRQILQDLSGSPLEIVMAEAFARRLEKASEEEKSMLRGLGGRRGEAAPPGQNGLSGAPSPPLTIRSAVDLPAAAKARIEAALAGLGFDSAAIRFEAAPALVSGIELLAGGYKIEWNVSSYLGALERAVEDVLEKAHEPA